MMSLRILPCAGKTIIFERMKYILLLFCIACFSRGFSQSVQTDSAFIRENYTKREVYITMRDGARLFTSIYIPEDNSQSYPFLLMRTPYSVAPYGDSNFTKRLGPNRLFIRDKYIFVYQDVRGRHMS